MKTSNYLATSLLACASLSAQAVTVWNPATTEEIPGVTSAGMTPTGFRFEIGAPPGEYPIQYSTHLSQWLPLGVIEPLAGTGAIVDAGALGRTAGFYRAGGSFEETPMHFLGFTSSVESAGNVDFGMQVRLMSGRFIEEAIFQSSNPANGLLCTLPGELSQLRSEHANGFSSLSGYAEFYGDGDVFPVTRGVDALEVAIDDATLEILKLEGEDHSFVGIFDYNEQYSDPGSGYSSTEHGDEMLFLAAKCTDAKASDMAGDWGFVVNRIESDPGRVTYSGQALVASMAASPLSASLSRLTEFKIDQFFDPALVETSFTDGQINGAISANLSSDGSFQLAAGMPFKGFVSPSARFFTVAANDPGVESIPPGEAEIFQPNLSEAQSQLIVGVKRDPNPQLGGKTYRIIRKGWWVEDNGFEIDRSASGDRLVFNAGGTSVTRNSELQFTSVSFDGVMESAVPGEETVTLTLAVTKDAASGQIDMQGGFTEEGELVTFRSFGFAQEGSDLLVLVDSITTSNGSAGLGLIIAVRVP